MHKTNLHKIKYKNKKHKHRQTGTLRRQRYNNNYSQLNCN